MFTITLATQNLGSEIFWSSTECICLVIGLHVEFAQAKVTQRNVTREVQKDVFWLQVTVKA